MLTANRALTLNAASAPELPRIEALKPLYDVGCRPRQGEIIMIAGRSGTQKSGFALWLAANWNLPTLYMSADMSGWQASIRLACMQLGMTTDQVEEQLHAPEGRRAVEQALAPLRITFSFSSPITMSGLEAEMDAQVELWDAYPKVIVIDNLMDIEGCDSDYAAQMAALQDLAALSRDTGSTILVLHHATDKSREAKYDPSMPPSREQVKGGLSEKPELSLSVALQPNTLEYRIAVIKQRMGPSDPTAQNYVTLRADPARTQFRQLALTD